MSGLRKSVMVQFRAGMAWRSMAIRSTPYAVGHYARWIKKGDVRVDATSTDPLLMVTAFASPARGTVAFVLINNAPEPRAVTFTLAGNQFNGNVSGEQSTNGGSWSSLGSVA